MAEVEIIKASQIKREIAQNSHKLLKVAAYCRVSTDDDEQLESYKSQVSYYTKIIDENPEWQKVAIYADEAITGTMVDKRESFQKMINDCMAGKIDLIITKSISRFARNTLDVLQYVRMLKDRRIAIQFEEEKINTLTMEGELLLSILSAVYQQEVENTSANVKKGLRMKMQRGELVGFQGCLGYDYDPETKSISLNEEEAEIVRLIFRLYLKGHGCNMIGRELMKRGYKTKRGNPHWSDTTVLGILKNEKYKGDVRMGKTFTVNPINKRRLKNLGEEDQIYIHDHHPAIITPEEFERVQQICEARSKNHAKGRADEELLSGTGKYVFSNILKCGFCGGTLSRRSWHSGTKYQKVIWHCLASTKNGKKNCPESCGIHEEAIQKAFVQSYTQTSNMNHDVAQETLARLRASLENEAYEDRIEEVSKEIRSLEKKIDQLLELRLAQKIPEDMYEEKFKRLNRKLEQKKGKREQLQLAQSKQASTEKRIQKIKNLLQSHEELQQFDEDVFLSVVKKVIIGGYDEKGVSQPMRIKFIYKTGTTDSLEGGDFRPPRINAKKRKQKTDKMKMLEQADILSTHTLGAKSLPSFSTDDYDELHSLSKVTARGEYCVATTKNIQESLIFSTSSPISASREIWMETPKKSLKTSSKWRYGYIWYW